MRPLIIAIGLVLILAVWLVATPSSAAPVMGTPGALPTVLTLHTSTSITITIPIPDSSLIANGVNLLRLGGAGQQPTILGVMRDDGQNGDAVAGDNIYTLQARFNELTTGQIQLQVSAAFRGLLKRVTSSPINIAVTLDGTRPLPPDPGPAGLTTLAGVDSDGDGVRDDVQRYIALTYPLSAKTRMALTQISQGLQADLLDASTKSLVVADTFSRSYARDCLDSTIATSDSDVPGLRNSADIFTALRSQVLNTPTRTQAYFQANGQLGALFYTRPNFPGLSAHCAVNPLSLPN